MIDYLGSLGIEKSHKRGRGRRKEHGGGEKEGEREGRREKGKFSEKMATLGKQTK